MSEAKPPIKPLLRGYFHQEAFFVAIGACLLLIAKSSNKMTLVASIVYSIGLLLMFGISAIYHRPHWEDKSRALMKRLDHSAIFILIASTTTPLCLLALSDENGFQLLLVIWIAALVGILQSIFWVKAPKFLSALFYIAMGWLASPYLGELRETLGSANLSLIVAGGIVYTLGGALYAMKRPKLFSSVFGYHELFHILTIVGATLHFIAIYQLIY